MTSFRFLQLADTQFGMFAHMSRKSADEREEMRRRGLKVRYIPIMDGFGPETHLFEETIAVANRTTPAFVVLCGDMVNDISDRDQIDEVLRVADGINGQIPLYWVPGNHDAALDNIHPEPKSISIYRANFGDDYYSFQYGDASFIVLNSTVMQFPEQVPDELEAEFSFLEKELKAAKQRDSSQIVLFTHHPLFGQDPGERDSPWNVPIKQRQPVISLLRKYGVSAVFSGHWHRNNYAFDGHMQMVTTGSVGFPLGDDPSGYRVVEVSDDRIKHDYHPLGSQTHLTGDQSLV